MTNLFQLGDFTLHSGRHSNFKIDCDALTDEDWETLAHLVCELVGGFRTVVGIPHGGLKLAEALEKYCLPDKKYPILIVDDVLTTGGSMEKVKEELGDNVTGAVVWARGKCPDWIIPINQLNDTL